jgi:hypothetical protein
MAWFVVVVVKSEARAGGGTYGCEHGKRFNAGLLRTGAWFKASRHHRVKVQEQHAIGFHVKHYAVKCHVHGENSALANCAGG